MRAGQHEVFVRHVSPAVTAAALVETCSVLVGDGACLGVRICVPSTRNKKSKSKSGMGLEGQQHGEGADRVAFIECASALAAEMCVRGLHGCVLAGRRVEAEISRDRRDLFIGNLDKTWRPALVEALLGGLAAPAAAFQSIPKPDADEKGMDKKKEMDSMPMPEMTETGLELAPLRVDVPVDPAAPTALNLGYCFARFGSHAAAARALRLLTAPGTTSAMLAQCARRMHPPVAAVLHPVMEQQQQEEEEQGEGGKQEKGSSKGGGGGGGGGNNKGTPHKLSSSWAQPRQAQQPQQAPHEHPHKDKGKGERSFTAASVAAQVSAVSQSVFIGNIAGTSVEVLTSLFGGIPGFCSVKLGQTGRRDYAFANYDSHAAALQAVEALDRTEVVAGVPLRVVLATVDAGSGGGVRGNGNGKGNGAKKKMKKVDKHKAKANDREKEKEKEKEQEKGEESKSKHEHDGAPQEDHSNRHDAEATDGSTRAHTPAALLQEYCRHNHQDVTFTDIATTGPAHRRVFTIQSTCGGISARGQGSSKKQARHAAAMALLSAIAAAKGASFRLPAGRAAREEARRSAKRQAKSHKRRPANTHQTVTAPRRVQAVRGQHGVHQQGYRHGSAGGRTRTSRTGNGSGSGNGYGYVGQQQQQQQQKKDWEHEWITVGWHPHQYQNQQQQQQQQPQQQQQQQQQYWPTSPRRGSMTPHSPRRTTTSNMATGTGQPILPIPFDLRGESSRARASSEPIHHYDISNNNHTNNNGKSGNSGNAVEDGEATSILHALANVNYVHHSSTAEQGASMPLDNSSQPLSPTRHATTTTTANANSNLNSPIGMGPPPGFDRPPHHRTRIYSLH